VRLIQILADCGYLSAGTALEVTPSSLPADVMFRDPRAFRAVVGDPTHPKSLIWEFDGQAYSPTELTCRLSREFGVRDRSVSSYYGYWRVIGETRTLWEEAKRVARLGKA
jgi:hypothetical protein